MAEVKSLCSCCDSPINPSHRGRVILTQKAIAAINELPVIFQAVFRSPRTPQQIPYRGTVS